MHPFLNIDLIVHFINTTLRGTHALTDFMVEIPSNWEVLLLDALLRRLDPGNASFYDQDKILAELKEQGFFYLNELTAAFFKKRNNGYGSESSPIALVDGIYSPLFAPINSF